MDIVTHIVSFLRPITMAKVSTTCRQFAAAVAAAIPMRVSAKGVHLRSSEQRDLTTRQLHRLELQVDACQMLVEYVHNSTKSPITAHATLGECTQECKLLSTFHHGVLATIQGPLLNKALASPIEQQSVFGRGPSLPRVDRTP